jgi:hypothetical protein
MGASTIVGQIGGLILWVVAAIFMVGQAIVNAVNRGSLKIDSLLAARAKPSERTTTKLDPPAPASPAPTFWRRLQRWWYSN